MKGQAPAGRGARRRLAGVKGEPPYGPGNGGGTAVRKRRCMRASNQNRAGWSVAWNGRIDSLLAAAPRVGRRASLNRRTVRQPLRSQMTGPVVHPHGHAVVGARQHIQIAVAIDVGSHDDAILNVVAAGHEPAKGHDVDTRGEAHFSTRRQRSGSRRHSHRRTEGDGGGDDAHTRRKHRETITQRRKGAISAGGRRVRR